MLIQCAMLFVLLFCSSDLLAQQTQQKGRVEFGGFYHHLTNDRGQWMGERVLLVLRRNPSTFVFEFVDGRRNTSTENLSGQTLVGSIYHDWSPKLYTFSKVQGSTSSPVFPKFSAYHEFNLKTAQKNRLVLKLGGGYANYVGINNINKVSYVVAGPAYYFPQRIIVSYRYVRHFGKFVGRDPNTHIAWLRIGEKSKSWTKLLVANGNYAYRSEDVAFSFDIQRRVNALVLEREQWLTSNFGIAMGLEHAIYVDRVKDQKVFDRYKGEMRFFRTW